LGAGQEASGLGHRSGKVQGAGVLAFVVLLAAAVLAAIGLVAAASAQGAPDAPAALVQRLTPEVLAEIFPGATGVRELADGGPPAASVHSGETLVGYAFSTLDVLRAPGYSTTPFDIVAGVTLKGQVTGAKVLFHREPYLINDTHRTRLLTELLGSLAGLEARVGAVGALPPQHVAGATISARAMRNAVLEGAGIVLRFRSGAQIVTEPTVDTLNFRPMTAEELIADGSLRQVIVTNADLERIMAEAGLAGHELEVEPWGKPEAIYIDFRVGYANPPTIGRNGAGQWSFDHLTEERPPGTHALILASHGRYDFRGSKYRNMSHGFRLERLQVIQGEKTFEFTAQDLIGANYALGRVAHLVILPQSGGFDPFAPWRAEVHATARAPDGTEKRFLLAAADYVLPDRYVLLPEPAPTPAWVEAWQEGARDVAILAAALGLLTVGLAYQQRIVRNRALYRWVRLGFLSFTLVWIGWIAGAQLSIVHLINYLAAPLGDLDLAFYLAEPLIVILSLYTLASLVWLGRGVFCGWLCPFGAMQELLANIARALRVPQWNPSERLQTRLWNLKYVILAVVVTLAFTAPDAGAVAAEVEPFKTAITAIFDRALPYLLWALVLLTAGLVTERAFCRFLCPLGAALAILDRLHIVELLERKPECGAPCRLCERSCPVKAIGRSGTIKMNECFQCLDCMVEFHDDRRCPPLAKLRKQATRAAAAPPIGGHA
jgi:transcriptional regulator of nitric oxide reductase